MERDGIPIHNLKALGKYSQVFPRRAFFFAVLLSSLAGIPPLTGFFTRFQIFIAAVSADLMLLAIFGGIASVIISVVYLRVVYIMYFGPDATAMNGSMPFSHWLIFGGSSIAVIFGIFNFWGIEKSVLQAAFSILH